MHRFDPVGALDTFDSGSLRIAARTDGANRWVLPRKYGGHQGQRNQEGQGKGLHCNGTACSPDCAETRFKDGVLSSDHTAETSFTQSGVVAASGFSALRPASLVSSATPALAQREWSLAPRSKSPRLAH